MLKKELEQIVKEKNAETKWTMEKLKKSQKNETVLAAANRTLNKKVFNGDLSTKLNNEEISKLRAQIADLEQQLAEGGAAFGIGDNVIVTDLEGEDGAVRGTIMSLFDGGAHIKIPNDECASPFKFIRHTPAPCPNCEAKEREIEEIKGDVRNAERYSDTLSDNAKELRGVLSARADDIGRLGEQLKAQHITIANQTTDIAEKHRLNLALRDSVVRGQVEISELRGGGGDE